MLDMDLTAQFGRVVQVKEHRVADATSVLSDYHVKMEQPIQDNKNYSTGSLRERFGFRFAREQIFFLVSDFPIRNEVPLWNRSFGSWSVLLNQ